MAAGASNSMIGPMRPLLAVAAAAWVCGFAARPGVGADPPAAPGADDPAKDTRVLVLGEADPTPQDFICREGPRRVTDPIDRFRKELPAGYSARVVIGRFYEPNWGKFDHYVREMVPLDADGKPDGTAKYYQPGRLIRTAGFSHGARHGEEIFYEYRRDAGGRHKRKVVPYRKGKIEGVVRLFYPDGKTMSETPYTDGKPHGVAKSFAPDGFVRRVVHYREGKRHGTMTERWSRTGELKKVIEYRDGLAHGSAKMYYDTGRLKMEATLWKDRFHGVEKRYDGDGKLRETRYWILDEQVGKDEFEKRFRMPPKPDPAGEQPDSRPATAPRRPAGYHGQGAAADETWEKKRLEDYCRAIDEQVKSVLTNVDAPLVIAAAEPLDPSGWGVVPAASAVPVVLGQILLAVRSALRNRTRRSA